MNNKIKFEKIVGSRNQILVLYQLLKERTNNISHKSMPNFDEHEKFVKNNSYKVWYLVLKDKKNIGSFYIKYDNSYSLDFFITSNK